MNDEKEIPFDYELRRSLTADDFRSRALSYTHLGLITSRCSAGGVGTSTGHERAGESVGCTTDGLAGQRA